MLETGVAGTGLHVEASEDVVQEISDQGWRDPINIVLQPSVNIVLQPSAQTSLSPTRTQLYERPTHDCTNDPHTIV